MVSDTAWLQTLHGSRHCMTSDTAWFQIMNGFRHCMTPGTAWHHALVNFRNYKGSKILILLRLSVVVAVRHNYWHDFCPGVASGQRVCGKLLRSPAGSPRLQLSVLQETNERAFGREISVWLRVLHHRKWWLLFLENVIWKFPSFKKRELA